MKTSGALAVAVVGLVAAGGFACDRTHMSPHFGEANRVAFHDQIIFPDAGAQRTADQPLDPEEAARVSKTYLRSLSPKDTNESSQGGGSPLLVVPNNQGPGMGPMPPSRGSP